MEAVSIGVLLDPPVLFDVFVPESFIDARGCEHVYELQPATCRGCSVTAQFIAARKAGAIDLAYWNADEFHPEFRCYGRRGVGRVVTDQGRPALTRLLAFLHGHPEPPLPPQDA